MPLPGRIGRLARHRVTIQTPGNGRDALGEIVPTWTNVATGIPAEVRSINAQEVLNADQQDAIVTHLITIRYRTDVTPLMRLKEGARIYNIVRTVDPDGRSRRLEIHCREYVDG